MCTHTRTYSSQYGDAAGAKKGGGGHNSECRMLRKLFGVPFWARDPEVRQPCTRPGTTGWNTGWMESGTGVKAVKRKITFFFLRSRTQVVRAAVDGFTESAFYLLCSERHLFVTLCEHYWHFCD